MKKEFLFLLTVLSFSIFISYNVFKEDSLSMYSRNGVALVPVNAPNLKDLFEDRDQGPHSMYNGEESCLVCHENSIDIPSIGKTPVIAHDYINNCISCHELNK